MSEKQTAIEDAIGRITDGMTVMVGGFGIPGTPFTLIDELARQGQKHLTLIKNDANEQGMGIDALLSGGQVRKLIVSHIGLNPRAVALMNSGALEVEFCAQGILAERIRAGGAGLKGIVTDIGLGTLLENGKRVVELHGQRLLIETALRADVTLIHADSADAAGNLVYVATARNFSPVMAMAADFVVVEVEHLVMAGGINPDQVHTPAPFVDALIPLNSLSEAYNVRIRA